MSLSRRLFLLLCAVVLFSIAMALIFKEELPNRADYTGQIIAGEHVAPEVNALAPPIIGTSITNNPINTYQLRGKPVIVNFWATWCGPCRVEMPILEEIYETNAENIAIIAVNLGESPSTVTRWVNEQGFTYEILIDSNMQIEALYNLLAPPSTYIISPEGVISNIFYGPTTTDTLQSAINPFISD